MASSKAKFSKQELQKIGIKLLTIEELRKITPGDWIGCDGLHQSLLHNGFKARYKNVVDDKAGFVAKFYIGNYYLGSVEGSDLGHMVREWNGLPE